MTKRLFALFIPLFILLPQWAFGQMRIGTDEAIFVRATAAYSDLTASYVALLTNTKQLRGCLLSNATDQPVSWDNSTTAILDGQPANTVAPIYWAHTSRDVRTTIRIKYTGSAPSSGNVYINCWY